MSLKKFRPNLFYEVALIFQISNLKQCHLADQFKKYRIRSTRVLRGYLRSYYMLFSPEPPDATSHTPALYRRVSALHFLRLRLLHG